MATTRPRPRAPDIQIYKPQLTSVLSILHRITGVLLSVGSVLLVAWLVAVAAGGDSYAMAERWLRSWIGMLLLLGWIFALFYHLCNGIRHLAWDLDFGFELGSIYRSGWTVVAVSVILTLATWTLGLAGGE
ncbi:MULTISPECIES: succinate dehydrogenase, cytochrome b556 subunit [Rhodanobacter]|uniref:succinate dehydrogenase, cytochrome b556 subunit n=1 Tax=Rhodanobacter TaxID=75309 RepID=UPI0003F6CD7A|nr:MULTISPECIES: succinate dehydrogenase, cytochrome b556 subunit [Rhodanobacter]TAN16000.1 MAG: succinate dehydrogenase, cytochrome b556 subunit [Rhodanobacter sp.]UJJ54662.1 succinate dehydrogenase, cytochrome b556 subunit [Rhodanobacter thiooxydans]